MSTGGGHERDGEGRRSSDADTPFERESDASLRARGPVIGGAGAGGAGLAPFLETPGVKPDAVSRTELFVTKGDNELVVAQRFASWLESQGERLENVRTQQPDPPDCVAHRPADGADIAIEITRLMDGRAMKERRWLRKGNRPPLGLGTPGHAIWTPEKIRAVVARPIDKKSTVSRAKDYGCHYDEYILLVDCDDPAELTPPRLEAALLPEIYPAGILTKIYLVQSYVLPKDRKQYGRSWALLLPLRF